MNHIISDDPGTSSYSPNYGGSHCIHCGKREDVNQKGECDKCTTSTCFLCETTVSAKSLRSVRDKQVCTECIDYEGIEAVRDLILRINLNEERKKRIGVELKLNSIINH